MKQSKPGFAEKTEGWLPGEGPVSLQVNLLFCITQICYGYSTHSMLVYKLHMKDCFEQEVSPLEEASGTEFVF